MAKPNADKSFTAASLIIKHLKGELSDGDKIELERWLAADHKNQRLFDELNSVDAVERAIKNFESSGNEAGWQRIQDKITVRSFVQRERNRKNFWKYAAAILIIAVAGWQIFHHQTVRPSVDDKPISRYGSDALPGTRKAELLLNDGTIISLGTNKDSMLADKGSNIHVSAKGEIAYEKIDTNGIMAWNTLRVPNGGQYIIILEDGTKVWMNSASTIRYPVRFTGKERKVELSEGEAYFEIAKNKEKPFIVVTDRMDVQAVGTAFDVNSYADTDSSTETTLIEGIVKVKALNKINTLVPGDKIITSQTSSTIVKADIESGTAWKNGLFLFNSKPLTEVMKQLARWYDLKIEYDRSFTDKKFFTGEINRNVPASKLLEMMQLTGIADFRITNKTIIVSSYTP